ncbi:hypothetical protein Rsub_02012 [Raphidocelis subcapitata]|uniref:SDR family NAD(P)-dependent oxidoreductase n=1 Tax=Raphidocelis subcapitata TaxID=307507 RepID=A0A2V0NV45_9CHLO|nr:hypothetical protein Rsub_02012 [Raphidocelis subcapitata]|eukprot:GBF89440.1 hypothetical protein Rsub_02012 [Raphidocelis subcapitata]
MGLLGWTRRDVPSLAGKVALVTGANSGIGFELTRQLVEHGAEVVMVGRDKQLLDWAARDLEEEFPGARVESTAREILSTKLPINILVNNAGRFVDAPFCVTPDGFEQTLASNYFGHALLTLMLLDRIAASGPGARIVNVSSPAEQYATADLDDITLFQIMFNHELHRRLRLEGRDIDCFAVHPGMVATGLSNKVSFCHPSAVAIYAAMRLSGQSPLQGAQSALFAATAPQLRGKGGAYIGPLYATNTFHAHERYPVNRAAYDYETCVKLFNRTAAELARALGHDVPVPPAVGARVPV